jgi:mannitol 2-dehydrogenase
LTSGALPLLADRVAVPTYDRARVGVGVVHIGVGAFHRSHQAMFHDRMLNAGGELDWGICGLGVLASDKRTRDAFRAQDGLYTLVLKHPSGDLEARVVGSIVEYIYAPDDPHTALERLAAPSTRIVSLTITEGGYNLDPATGEFDATNDAIVADAKRRANPETAFGLVVEALVLRRGRGLAPFAVVSCDNLPGNGELSRRVFADFARLRDPSLAEWIRAEVPFPNSMVDRITPATTAADIDMIRERFGIDDAWPVVAEPFEQWVLEDHFPLGRPRYEDVGVQLVESAAPYELMKLRLLNGGHQALAYFAALHGYRFVHEAARDPVFRRFLLRYMNEARRTLPPVPGIDLDEYVQLLLERFSNAHVADQVARLCVDASDRIPKFVLPVARDLLLDGRDLRFCAAVVASWARYAEGRDDDGSAIEIVDPLATDLAARARRQIEEPDAFIANQPLFGALAEDERFLSAYRWALRSLHSRGARGTLEALMSLGE